MKIKTRLSIELTLEEANYLAALAIHYGKPPEKLLQAFVSDATGSLRSNGSDERQMATAYLDRRHLPRASEMTRLEWETMEYLQDEAYRARRAIQIL